MSSTFFGLSVAASGLNAQMSAMNVLGYNLAHASDTTYKRQQLSTSEAVSSGNGSGAGVATGDVVRVRDALVENRLRVATTENSEWQYKSNFLTQVESALGEPSDTGLQSSISAFWSAWQAVATSPESTSTRSALLADASTLCEQIQYTYSQLSDAVDDLNAAVVDRVDRINDIAQQIATLNDQINSVAANEMSSNDLLNTRDALVSELSELASITQHGDGKGGYIISIGGRVLVQDTSYNALSSVVESGKQTVRWASDGQDLSNDGGELKAIIELRDETIDSYMQSLDQIATALVEQVNALHTQGTTLTGTQAGNFFKAGTTAANICLDDSITDNPKLVGASATGEVGDGSNATSIADLASTPVINGLTIDQLYSQFVSDVGSFAQASESRANSCQLSVDQYTSQQQSVSGVNTDEELTNMIKYQQAYNAAARMVTIFDEMLSTLVQTGA